MVVLNVFFSIANRLLNQALTYQCQANGNNIDQILNIPQQKTVLIKLLPFPLLFTSLVTFLLDLILVLSKQLYSNKFLSKNRPK